MARDKTRRRKRRATGGLKQLPWRQIVNPYKPPFDKAEIRKAMVMSIDRAAFIKILTDGEATLGGAMMPPPEGVWGMPPEVLAKVAGYGPDVEKNRRDARKIMKKMGYGPNNKLKITVSTRNIALYRDPAVILMDHV